MSKCLNGDCETSVKDNTICCFHCEEKNDCNLACDYAISAATESEIKECVGFEEDFEDGGD